MKIEVEEIAKVRVDPGDVVVLRFDSNVDAETFDFASAKLKEYFPDNKTLVLGPGADLEVYSAGAAV